MSTLSSVNANALAGIQAGQQGVQRAAQDIASSGPEGLDVAKTAESLVSAKQHAQATEASAKMIEVNDRAIGHLIDILV